MSVEVVSKKKTGSVCESCDHPLTSDEIKKKECGECGSKELKKTLTLVRKAVGDEEDDLETAIVDDSASDEDDEDDEDEDDDDDDDIEDDLDDDEDDDIEDDLDDDEDEEDDDEDDDDSELVLAGTGAVKKSDLRALEILNISTALAEDITKIFKDDGSQSDYEEVMVDLNNVLDSASAKWFKGTNITKSADAAGAKKIIRERVEGIIGKEKTVTKKTKKVAPTGITKRDDLPEDVRKSLEAADKIVEERQVEHWEKVAKGYANFPGDKKKLAVTLRKLNDADPKAFQDLKTTLDAAEEGLATSEVFKSWGQTGGDETDDGVDLSKAEKIAKAEKISVEQAKVRLMDGKNYQPTNA